MIETLTTAPWWLGGFALVGALAVATIVVALFSALGRRPVAVSAENAPPVDSEAFLLAFAGVVGSLASAGGRARLLNNGDAFFPAILSAIAAARRSINVMVYIWEPGQASDRMFAALMERLRAGVEVRLLMDAMGGLRTPDDDLERIRAAGGRVARYRPARFGTLTRLYKRNHRRAIVVDGERGFIGGAAVGDKWLGDAQDPDHWRDSMLDVTGPPARSLQAAFAQLWASTCGEILTGDAFWPDGGATSSGDSIERYVSVLSNPGSEDHPLRQAFVLSFLAARESLYITTPYFVPDRSVRRAVMTRARAGVDVRILLPSKHTDAKPIRRASHRFYDVLLTSGVRIYEYQPTMLHAKHVVVDGRWVIVGSPNMDVRSYELNDENVLGILDHELGAEVVACFFADLKHSSEIDLHTWRRRGLAARAIEHLASLPAEQY